MCSPVEKTKVELLLSDHHEERERGEAALLEEVRSYGLDILAASRIVGQLKQAGHRLSRPAREECLDYVARNIIRWDGRSHLGYTNKVLYEIYVVLCGGELLGERCTAARGKRRFLSWVNLTALTGAPWEYLSAMYTSTTTGALYSLIQHCGDPEVVFRARVMLEKVWLHVASHYHHRLRELAGPYSRCVAFPSVNAGGMMSRIRYFAGWQTFYHKPANEDRRVEPKTDLMPSYVQEIMTDKSFPSWVRETYQVACQEPPAASGTARLDQHEWFSLVDSHPRAPNVLNVRRASQFGRDEFRSAVWGRTYLAHEFTMGSRNVKVLDYAESYAQSSINFVVQHLKPEAREHPNRWLFARYHNSAAPQTYLGSVIWSNQDRNVALVAGVPQRSDRYPEIEAGELYLYFAFECLEGVDAVYVDGEKVEALPFPVRRDSIVVIEDSDVLIGLRPIVMAGVQGFEAEAELSAKTFAEISYDGKGGRYDADKPLTALEMFSCRGPERSLTHDDLKPALALAAVEVHPRSAFENAQAFADHLRRAEVQRDDDAAIYTNSGRRVELPLDFATPIDDCPTNDAEGPNYVQNRTGRLELHGATVASDSATPLGLAVTPSGNEYVLLHLGDHPVTVRFRCGDYEATVEDFDFGRARFFPTEGRHDVQIVQPGPDTMPYW